MIDMKYGQLVTWMGNRRGQSYRYVGIALDVIMAGEYLSDSKVVKEKGLKVKPENETSLYDRVLVYVSDRRNGLRGYFTPRLAKVRAEV